MKKIEISLKETIEKELASRDVSGMLKAQMDFLRDIKDKHLNMPQKYTISPLDTIGKRKYSTRKVS